MIPAKYSLTWALSIVWRLKQEHARATEVVLYWLQISEKTLAKALAKPDNVFHQIRTAIKIVENWENSPNWSGWTLNNRIAFYGVLQSKGYERLCTRLDSLNFRHRIKEQESSGGSPAYSPGGPQHFASDSAKEEPSEDCKLSGSADAATKRGGEKQSPPAPRGRPARRAKEEEEDHGDCATCESPCLFRTANLEGGLDGKQCRPYDGCTGTEHGYKSLAPSSGSHQA